MNFVTPLAKTTETATLAAALRQARMGNVFAYEELEEIYRDGYVRYKDEVPPGYKDAVKAKRDAADKKQDKSQFGDLVIWKQVIAAAKSDEKPVLYVTDDNKVDWFENAVLKNGTKSSGPEQKARGRMELYLEFYRETGMQLRMRNFEGLLELARTRYCVQIGPERPEATERSATGLPDEVETGMPIAVMQADYLTPVTMDSFFRLEHGRLPQKETVLGCFDLRAGEPGTFWLVPAGINQKVSFRPEQVSKEERQFIEQYAPAPVAMLAMHGRDQYVLINANGIVEVTVGEARYRAFLVKNAYNLQDYFPVVLFPNSWNA